MKLSERNISQCILAFTNIFFKNQDIIRQLLRTYSQRYELEQVHREKSLLLSQNIFSFEHVIGDTSFDVQKMLIPFVYIFIANCQFFQLTPSGYKPKIDMLYPFRQIVLQIFVFVFSRSANVGLPFCQVCLVAVTYLDLQN